MNFVLLRKFIRQQFQRNSYTLDDSPNTFKDFKDYNVELGSNVNGSYTLTIYYKGEKLGYSTEHNDYEEGNHHARMIIDNHRVKVMHTNGQKEKVKVKK